MAKRIDPSLTPSQEKAVQQWAGKAPTEVLACRTFGHTWVHGITDVYRINGDYVREIGCGRCGMIRRDVTPVGEYGALRRGYIAPSNYRRDVDDEGSTRTPRWAVVDALTKRADEHTIVPQAIVDWYYKRGHEE